MATVQAYLFPDSTVLANFKAWAQLISNALASFSWTQTSDSGQVNWASIATVPAANTYVYEVWKSGDALSSTNPIYLKLEYGSTGAAPSVAVTVGSGSNGSGVLTNNGTRNVLTSGTSGTTATLECDIAGSSGYFAFTMFRGATYPCFFTVERSHTSTGTDTAAYCTTLASGAPSSMTTPFCYQQTIFPPGSGGPQTYESFGLTFQTANTSTVTIGNQIVATPFWPVIGKMDNPLLCAVCIKDADVGDGFLITVNLYGTTHTYIVAKTSALWANQNTNSVAMRFE